MEGEHSLNDSNDHHIIKRTVKRLKNTKCVDSPVDVGFSSRRNEAVHSGTDS
jgi:hypothetical protein